MTAWAAQLRPAGQVRSTSDAAAPCRAWEAHEWRGPAGGRPSPAGGGLQLTNRSTCRARYPPAASDPQPAAIREPTPSFVGRHDHSPAAGRVVAFSALLWQVSMERRIADSVGVAQGVIAGANLPRTPNSARRFVSYRRLLPVFTFAAAPEEDRPGCRRPAVIWVRSRGVAGIGFV